MAQRIIKIIIHLCFGMIPIAVLLFLLLKAIIVNDPYESLGYCLLMLPCLIFINAYLSIIWNWKKKGIKVI